MSLGHRFAVFALLFIGLLSAQWAASVDRERRILVDEAAARAKGLARALAELAGEPIASGRVGQLDAQLASFMRERDAAYARVVDPRARVVAASDPSMVGWTLSAPPEGAEALLWEAGLLVARAAVRVPGLPEGYAEFALHRGPIDAKLRDSRAVLARFLAFGAVLFALFFYSMYRQLIVPVRSLVRSLGEARPEAAPERISLPPASAPEIRRIAGAVDELRARAVEYQAELVAEERLATIGRMAADVAHEVRNPLEAISGAAELLSGMVPADDQFARVLRDEVRNLNEYLTGVLEFAKGKPGTAAVADLADIGREAAALAGPLAREHGVRVEAELRPASCVVPRLDIKRAALNLTLNAIEASPEGEEISLRSGEEGGRSYLCVRDRGPGLPGDARLFEPYFTTKADGTGLGLTLARQAVEAGGGELSLGPAPGGGVEARISFPRAEAG